MRISLDEEASVDEVAKRLEGRVSPAVLALVKAQMVQAGGFGAVTRAVADPGKRQMFGDRLYERGGLTVHALRCALGEDGFFRMLRDWTRKHRHGTVSTADFTAHAQRYAASPLDGLFDAWLREPSLPPLPNPTDRATARPARASHSRKDDCPS